MARWYTLWYNKGGKTMKANELQIGDWVRVLPISHKVEAHNSQVGALTRNVNNTISIEGGYFPSWRGWSVSEEYIEPIPLTEEILLVNGFKKVDLTIGNYALKLEEKGKYDVHTILWGGVFDGRMDLEFKVMGEHIHIDKKIRYVHELQHALRLCGLDEIADNLKLIKNNKTGI